jgi:hypothetical protein
MSSKGIDEYNKAIELNRKFADAYTNRGNAYYVFFTFGSRHNLL